MTGPRQQPRRLRVVHLEDNSLDAELIAHSLKDHGVLCSIIRVDTKQSFDAALEKGGIDLILSDSQLPGFDTLTVVTQARERLPEVPFIFVSGAISPKIKADAFRRGATDFISKGNLPKLAHIVHWIFFLRKQTDRKLRLPEIGVPVVVQCKQFRCLGYLAKDGTWRDYGTSSELKEVIDWSEI